MRYLKKGGLNIYRVILQGKRKPELFLIPEKLKSFGNITEVLDETRPAYDLEELQKKYAGTLIGDYICFFMEKNRNTWKIRPCTMVCRHCWRQDIPADIEQIVTENMYCSVKVRCMCEGIRYYDF